MLYKIDVLKNFAKLTAKTPMPESIFKKSCGPEAWTEALAQVFSCEFCEIPKNIFFTEYLWTSASDCEFFL